MIKEGRGWWWLWLLKEWEMKNETKKKICWILNERRDDWCGVLDGFKEFLRVMLFGFMIFGWTFIFSSHKISSNWSQMFILNTIDT